MKLVPLMELVPLHVELVPLMKLAPFVKLVPLLVKLQISLTRRWKLWHMQAKKKHPNGRRAAQ